MLLCLKGDIMYMSDTLTKHPGDQMHYILQ